MHSILRDKRTWIGVFLLAAIAAAVWVTGDGGEIRDGMQEIRVTRGDLEIKVLSNGVVQPQNRLEIKPPIAGRIEEILVREGDEVEKGQILAWMSSTERATLLDAARAKGSGELARWEELFKPTPLIAPLSGLLIVRNVEPGQVVTAQDPVLVMSDHLIVRVQVDETDIARVAKGQPAVIRLEAYPKERIPGVVDSISYESTVVNNVTIYEVDVLPDQVPDFMRSGMSAEVEFLVARREDVLLVPATAVRQEGDGAFVEGVDPSSPKKTVTKEVSLGLSDGRMVEITGGLREGDIVLTAGYRASSGEGDQAVSPLNPLRRRRR